MSVTGENAYSAGVDALLKAADLLGNNFSPDTILEMIISGDTRLQIKSAAVLESARRTIRHAENSGDGLLKSDVSPSDGHPDTILRNDRAGATISPDVIRTTFVQKSDPLGSCTPSFARSVMLSSTGTSLASSEAHSEDSSNGYSSELEGHIMPFYSSETSSTRLPELNDSSHFRLRSALLNSGRAISNPVFQSDETYTDCSTVCPTLNPKHNDDSAVAYSNNGVGVSTKPIEDSSIDPAGSVSSSFSSSLTRSLSRPPSASNIFRRASCEEFGQSPNAKSASQPQSPDFHPRHNAVLNSPCRLPMKKRKVDWNQLDYQSSNSASVDFVPLPAPPTCSLVKRFSKLQKPRSQTSSLGNQNQLVIDCPLNSLEGSTPEHRSRCTSSFAMSAANDLSGVTQSATVVSSGSVASYERLISSSRLKLIDDAEAPGPKLPLLARTLTSVPDLSRACLQPTHISDSNSQLGPRLQVQHLNASDPCIHPPERQAIITSSNNQRVHPELSSQSPAFCMQHSGVQISVSNSHNSPFSTSSLAGLINKPIELLAGSGKPVTRALCDDEQFHPSAKAQVTMKSSGPIVTNQSNGPPKHSTVATSSDGAQVLMMLSPTNGNIPQTSMSSASRDHYSLMRSSFTSGSASSSFPLLLISASSSAGAEALAAAAAIATGAPPSSLVPVPVRLTAYVPGETQTPVDSRSMHGDLSNTPRFMISVCTPPGGSQSNTPEINCSDKKPSAEYRSSVQNTAILSHTAAMAHPTA